MAGAGRQNADTTLIAALASGQTIREAARTAGVGERTVHRRLHDPAFRQAVSTARADLLTRAIGQLADSTCAAATTLRALLETETGAVRLGAARAVLEYATRGIELVALAERVAAVEERLEAERRPRRVG